MKESQRRKRTRAYVCIGSNMGDRAGYLLLAVRAMLNGGLPISRLSSVYETEPVDLREQPEFLNMVAELRGTLPSPEELLAHLLEIERLLGRQRGPIQRGPRTVDLDLLLYDDVEISSDFLTLPHPRLHLRRFVLAPLAEIAPRARHPTLKRTAAQLLAEVCDAARVEVWPKREIR